MESIIKYKTNIGFNCTKITKIIIAKETPSQVILINGYRERKKSHTYNYYNTFEEAKQALLKYIKIKIEYLEDKILELQQNAIIVHDLTEENI